MPGNVGQLSGGLECGEKTTGQNSLLFVLFGSLATVFQSLWLFCLFLVALSMKLTHQGSIKWLNINYIVVPIQQRVL